MKRILIIIWMVPLLIACRKEIEYNGAFEDPKLVLQTCYEIGEDSTDLLCSVTRSSFFLTGEKKENLRIKDATVYVQVNDNTPVQHQAVQSEYLYRVSLPAPLKSGDAVRVTAVHADFPSVEGSDTVPAKPLCHVSSFVPDGKTQTCTVRIQFDDNTASNAFFGMYATYYYEMVNTKDSTSTPRSKQLQISSFDNIFATLGNTYSTSSGYNSRAELFFLPQEASNREVELYLPLIGASSAGTLQHVPKKVSIQCIAHSEHSYRYWRSMYAYLSLNGDSDADLGAMFAEMFNSEENVQIYNNVKDGFGIVSAASVITMDYYFTTE